MDYGVIAIIVICVFILFIGILKQKVQFVFNFVVRGILGLTTLYFCNGLLKMQGISIGVGINPISFLTIGSLGISGVALLYGILLYKNL